MNAPILEKSVLPLNIRSQRTADFLHFFPFDEVTVFQNRSKDMSILTKKIEKHVYHEKTRPIFDQFCQNGTSFGSIL